jgi:hypothetical protein
MNSYAAQPRTGGETLCCGGVFVIRWERSPELFPQPEASEQITLKGSANA